MSKPSIAMIGLAVMGSNLARNIESRGFPVAVYNRDGTVTDRFMAQFGDKQFVPAKSPQELISKMERPRQLFLMIKAGAAVDAVMDQLIPLLEPGDMIIDGGNSHYPDTARREERCREAGLNFIGLGVSGGEEGALKGPSLMPGGPKPAWEILSPVLSKIAAVAEGAACTTYVGPSGSGHFVKMVHNGIEYGDMQLIAEAYDLLSRIGGLKPDDLAAVFDRWNQGVLLSFLIEITAKIFKQKDDSGAGYLVDKILDKAAQKGTGKWTLEAALDLGIPIPTLAAAVDARALSSFKDERVTAAKQFNAPRAKSSLDANDLIRAVHDALYCSKIMAYAQGMALLSAASKAFKWDLKLDQIAAIWRGGCIIRARFLNEITRAYKNDANLQNLVLDPFMHDALTKCLPNLRKTLQLAVESGIPTPAFSASLAYFDSYTCANLPQNLTQAQRDFFGAHTFERKDKVGTFHFNWGAE